MDERELFRRLDKINRTLEKRNEIAGKTLDVMEKPEGKFSATLKTVVLMVGALGFVHTADVIRRWITGG